MIATNIAKTLSGGAAVAFALLLGACDGGTVGDVTAPDIPFALPSDTALKDPDNPIKTFRVDFARVENEFPLSRADLMKITPRNIASLSQEQVDQIYGRLTAGPVPDGTYQGSLFFPHGDPGEEKEQSLRPRLEEIVGGIEGRAVGLKIGILENLGQALWKGKVFERDKRVLRNMIEDREALRAVVDDSVPIPTTTIPRAGPLGWILPGNEVWLLFPAKLYCGQSLVDARRESVIVDYNYSDDIEGYRARPDSLAGRGGLRIRDEIRMVRPGFYLGRAYANRMLLLNFTLYNSEVADSGSASFAAGGAVMEDCWIGEQVRKAAVR
jgi:hypothetical protein